MKKFVFISITSLIFILSTIATINYFVDPYWCFNHSYSFNQFQRASNERQQKTNQIYFGTKQYEGLLFGSSRVTLFDKRNLNGNVFNYACSDMQPKEYKTFIEFAIKHAKQDIKTVYLGLDFYGSLGYGINKYNDTQKYTKNTLSSLYRYKLLLSIDALNNSAHNLKRFYRKTRNTYNRDNLKSTFNEIGSNEQVYDTKEYLRYKYDPRYRDPNFKNYLEDLKNSFPDVKFVVFTTPTTATLIDTIVQNNLYEKYEAWIKDIVSVFGEVNHFMFKNELLIQNKYFMDSNHAYPVYYAKIAKVLNNEQYNKKIVMKIDKKNLKEKLDLIRIQNNKETL